MVIVLKVSFSPARERILLTGPVQRDSLEPRAVPRGEEPGARVQAGHQRGGPALTAAAPGRSLSHHGVLIKCRLRGNRPHSSPRRACGDCPAFQAAPLRKWRVQSVAGYPGLPQHPGRRQLARDEAFGSSDWIKLSVCSHVVTYCRSQTLLPKTLQTEWRHMGKNGVPSPHPTATARPP